MKKLALLFVALMGTTIAVTAAPLQTKTSQTPQTPQTTKEVASTKPAAKKTTHKATKEVKKTEAEKPVEKK